MKITFKYFSIALLIVAILFLGYSFFKGNQVEGEVNNIQFHKTHYTIYEYADDSLYNFNVILENKSEIKRTFSLISTCGCTVVDKPTGTMPPGSIDTLSIAVSTYGKKTDFSTHLFLYTKDHVVIDTFSIYGFKLKSNENAD